MQNIVLSNNVTIPVVGFGVFRSKDGSETQNAVTWALDSGYTHIDTAMIYQNEESVGAAIKNHPVGRENIFLTTKLWNEDIRQQNFRKAFETSLEKLQTDYLDLYLIHWPVENRLNAWKELEQLYKEQKIKAIGVSNFHQHHLEELFEIAEIMPMVNQIETHPLLSNQPLIDFCHSHNIAVQAWGPLGGDGAPILSNPILIDMAQKYNKTVAQLIYRWNIQRNVIVLSKSVNQDRIKQNIDVFDFEISSSDMEIIHGLNENKRVGSDPDNFNF